MGGPGVAPSGPPPRPRRVRQRPRRQASPHLFAYDLLILTPLVVASADCMLAAPQRRWLGRLTYLGFLAPLWGVPLAALGLQVSTPVLLAWIVAFAAVAQEVAMDPSDTS